MKKNITRDALSDELVLAIGLVWGHLNARQFEQAVQLARGCLRLWPEQELLILMAAYATVELSEPLDRKTLAVLNQADCADWTELVLRRAGLHGAATGRPLP